MKLEFYRQIFEKCPLNLMKIRPMGAELFHGDRQTDRRDEANSRFPQFCERAYKRPISYRQVDIRGAWGSVVVKALRY